MIKGFINLIIFVHFLPPKPFPSFAKKSTNWMSKRPSL
jgi:hypothetical protein